MAVGTVDRRREWFDGSMHVRARRQRGDRDAEPLHRPPAPTREAPTPDGLLALQRLAGNRAVAGLVGGAVTIQRAGPTPQPYERNQALIGNELGETQEVKGSTPPRFHVKSEAKPGGGLRGSLETTEKGSFNIESHYVPAGVHDDVPAENGTKRKLLVPDKVAEVVKAGEQEHSDDIWWAHELVWGEAARAINVLAGQAPHDAANITELHRSWREALAKEITPKLSISAARSDPAKGGGTVSEPWSRALAALGKLTKDRDDLKWHTMPTRAATADERKAHGITSADTYLAVAEVGGQIGQHKSEAYIKAGFDALQPMS
jgi:hypothetical protein